MTRAVFFDNVQDRNGRPAGIVTVALTDPTTHDPIAETIYAGDSGSAVLSNPFFTNALGEVQFYLERERNVRVTYTVGTVTKTVVRAVVKANAPANEVPFTPAGSVASTDVQAAIEEIAP